jgi:putative transposase
LADLTLDKQMLQDVLSKKAVRPSVQRDPVGELIFCYRVSERRACENLAFIRYKSIANPQIALRMRLRELVVARVGYGYRRLHILLWREGW